jgi:hypothetical protein
MRTQVASPAPKTPKAPKRVERVGHPSARDLLGAAWMTRRISIQPFGVGWWSFNPSVHHDRPTAPGVSSCAARTTACQAASLGCRGLRALDERRRAT